MNVNRQGRKRSVTFLLQSGLISASLLAILPLLSIGVFVAIRFDGTVAIPVLLIIAGTLVAICVGMLVIYVTLLSRIEGIFRDAVDQCRLYMAGNHTVRFPASGNDSFTLLLVTLNSLLADYAMLLRRASTGVLVPLRDSRYRVEQYSGGNETGGRSERMQPDTRFSAVALLDRERDSAMQRMQHTVSQVMKETQAIVAQSSLLEQATLAQSIQIFQTTETIEGLASSIRETTRNAQSAASLTNENVHSIHKAQQALYQTMSSLPLIHHDIGKATRQVYRVEEHATALVDMMHHLEEVGTHLKELAQQAPDEDTTQAQVTAVMAQVQKLADSTLHTIHQMNSRVEKMEQDTRQAVVDLQQCTQQFVDKSLQAEGTGRDLLDLYQSMEQQSVLLKSVLQSAQQQTQVADQAAHAMSQIAEVTFQTSRETQSSIRGMRNLATLSEQLRSSVPEIEEHVRETDSSPVETHSSFSSHSS